MFRRMNNIRQKDDKRINLILELVNFFDKHAIDYMLGGGTACQLLKDGEIYTPLDKDHDIDFHIWEEQQSHFSLKVKELEDSGFEIKDYGYKVQLSKPNLNLIVEIMFLFREGNNVYFRTTDSANNGKRSCATNCFERQSLVISNKTINVVSQKYCECLY